MEGLEGLWGQVLGAIIDFFQTFLVDWITTLFEGWFGGAA